jgi:chorismate mutase
MMGTDPLGRLLDLVIQRLALAHDVAAAKYANGRPIDDHVREREILQAVTSALEASGPRDPWSLATKDL